MRPRGRTRRLRSASKKSTGSFNPRVLAGGRDALPPLETAAQRFQSPRPRGRTRHSVRFVFLSRVMFQSPCPYNLAISRSRNLALSQSRNLALSRSRNLALSRSRNLAISQSRCKRRESGKSKQGRKSARRRPQSEVRYGCTTRGSLLMQEECPCILSSQPTPRGHWNPWNKQHPGLPGKTDALLSRYRFFRII